MAGSMIATSAGKPRITHLASRVTIQHAAQHHSSSSGSMRVGRSQSAHQLAAKGAAACIVSIRLVTGLRTRELHARNFACGVLNEQVGSCSN